MATDDSSLMTEVREQTELTDTTLLSDSRLSALLSNAKREIETTIGREPDWYENRDAENALFWLACLFVIDEGSTDQFSFGELEVRPESDAEADHPWVGRYERSLRYLMDSASLFGLSNVNRTDRSGRPGTDDGELA
ncbi:hypothetical protein M1M38_gp014 [Halorubrum tailed virus 27]|uniref:Uncharacterized protein n=1 Tax=Halorubrum tailed virus 27 TaxID=2878008 RepID=A0AAE8XYP4_9CAUD|nr:hypothetical protein M1M38_gp014 [Halorubrum tailed virus 27]UBF22707.1 hypothetical protein HRTV-27_gp14 [Halorubrum tailed virus 27]